MEQGQQKQQEGQGKQEEQGVQGEHSATKTMGDSNFPIDQP